jgi:hypothetical protein
MKKAIALIRATLLFAQLTLLLPIQLFSQCQPECTSGFIFEWNLVDLDGDGTPDTTNTLDAHLLIANSGELEACGGDITYSIHPIGTTPDINLLHYPLEYEDCNTVLYVEVAAWQNGELLGACPTYVFVQSGFLCEIVNSDTALIFGAVRTPCGQPVVGLPLYLNGDTAYTNITGHYSFEVDTGGDYTLAPFYNEDHANGVDSNDLVLISQLVVDTSLATPYHYIAADVNNSEAISTLDIVALSKLILGIDTVFSNNTSWRFIHSDFAFPDPTDPWLENFTEVVNINNLSGSMSVDFVAIKIGDLNCSANPILNTPGLATIQGVVFEDFGGDCVFGVNDAPMEGWIVTAESETNTYYASSGADGAYSILMPPGTYEMAVSPPNALWEPCNAFNLLTLEEEEVANHHFGAHPNQLCPFMEVGLSTLELIRCEQNTYQVSYSNQGSAVAEDAWVELTFGPLLSVVGSSVQLAPLGTQAFGFYIGDLQPGEGGSFDVEVYLSCDALEGAAHCVEARVYPNDYCASTDPSWDGALLDIQGACTGDSLQFTITNNGTDMLQARPFIVIEDDLVMMQGTIQLEEGAQHIFTRPANGSTQRLELISHPGPYGSVTPNTSVEGCAPAGVAPSLGYVTAYSQESGYPFEHVMCMENGTTTTNAIQAYPQGLGEENDIRSNTGIHYQITFQNTTNNMLDAAVLQCQLPDGLDPATFKAGPASHPYRFSLSGEGLVSIYLENMELPSSVEEEAASRGYVRFYTGQQENNPEGLIIENAAAIYQLGGNGTLPITTNEVWHTVRAGSLLSDSATVSGFFATTSGQPVEAITYLWQEQVPLDTASGGFYLFELPIGENYSLQPYREEVGNNGVSTFDIVLIAQKILGVNSMDNPYQIIASDVDQSGSVTIMDLIAVRKMILGLDNPLEYADWRFVLKDYIFPDPLNPWQETFPETVELTPLSGTVSSEFVAIRVGDVNNDWQPLQSDDAEDRSALPLVLKQTNQKEWRVLTDQPQSMIAWQVVMDLPEDAQLEEAVAATEEGAFYYSLNGRTLRALWYHTKAVHHPQGQPLFYLKGEGLGRVALSDTGLTRAFETNGTAVDIHLLHADPQIEPPSVVPNPANNVVSFNGLSSGRGVVGLYNAQGQVVLKKQFCESHLELQVGHLPKGVYYYQVVPAGQVLNYEGILMIE